MILHWNQNVKKTQFCCLISSTTSKGPGMRKLHAVVPTEPDYDGVIKYIRHL